MSWVNCQSCSRASRKERSPQGLFHSLEKRQMAIFNPSFKLYSFYFHFNQRGISMQCCLQVSRQSRGSKDILGSSRDVLTCTALLVSYPGVHANSPPRCMEDPKDIPGSSLDVPQHTALHSVWRIPRPPWDPPCMSSHTALHAVWRIPRTSQDPP